MVKTNLNLAQAIIMEKPINQLLTQLNYINKYEITSIMKYYGRVYEYVIKVIVEVNESAYVMNELTMDQLNLKQLSTFWDNAKIVFDTKIVK